MALAKKTVVIIKQISDFTCTLACIQSFFADNFREITQTEMIFRFPYLCGVGTKIQGAFPVAKSTFDQVGSSLGFDVDELKAIEEPKDKECVLIIPTNYGGKGIVHTVRYHKECDADHVWMMDPSPNRYSEVWSFAKWKKADLPAWSCQYYLLKLK